MSGLLFKHLSTSYDVIQLTVLFIGIVITEVFLKVNCFHNNQKSQTR